MKHYLTKEKMMEEIKFIETNKEDKAWVAKFRNFMIVLLVGFAIGSMVSNITFTYQLQQDCDTMKQFRVGKVAYTCMVK
jgi:hypothetical protein